MKDIVKEKQLKEILYGLDYIANKSKSGKLELGVNNCKLLLEEIERLTKENKDLQAITNIEMSTNEYLEKENIRLNSILNEIEAIIYNNQITGIEARLEIQERLDKLQEVKGEDKE